MTDGGPIPERNVRHEHGARDALFQALEEVGFAEALQAFANEHPAPAPRLAKASKTNSEYVSALDQLTASWDLGFPWFREYCHDLVWARHHERVNFPPSMLVLTVESG